MNHQPVVMLSSERQTLRQSERATGLFLILVAIIVVAAAF